MVSRWELEEELGHVVTDKHVEYLVNKGLYGKWREGKVSVKEMADELRMALQASGQPQVPTDDEERLIPPYDDLQDRDRDDSLSYVLALQAGRDEQISEFRKEVLRGKLLAPEEVPNWIYRQADRDGKHTRLLTEVPVPDQHAINLGNGSFTIDPPLVVTKAPKAQVRVLSIYEDGLEGDQLAINITQGGVLDQLLILCFNLTRKYGWKMAQAVTFVLTNATIPFINPFRATAQLTSPFSALTRITMTVDPTLSPNEVAERYRFLRGELLGERHRDLTRKHHLLAVFYAGSPANETWDEKMDAWNSRPLPWKYKAMPRFKRDCIQALDRLLNPSYRIPIHKEGANGETRE